MYIYLLILYTYVCVYIYINLLSVLFFYFFYDCKEQFVVPMCVCIIHLFSMMIILMMRKEDNL